MLPKGRKKLLCVDITLLVVGGVADGFAVVAARRPCRGRMRLPFTLGKGKVEQVVQRSRAFAVIGLECGLFFLFF